jgi:Secretion system C-terminal sorting domain
MKNYLILICSCFLWKIGIAQDLTTRITHVQGGQLGAINLTMLGGYPPYDFIWTGPNNFRAFTEDISGLQSGQYCVDVSDAHCGTLNWCLIVEACRPIIARFSQSAPCQGQNNGSIAAVTYSSARPPLRYQWSNGQTTQTATNLAAGSYSVTVTDAVGCTDIRSEMLLPQTILVEGTVQNTCPGSMTGGVRLEANIISASRTAMMSFRWSNGSTEQNLTGVGAGTYTVTVTGGNNCTQTAHFNVRNLLEDGIIEVTQTQNPSGDGLCDGSVNLTATGVGAPFTFRWSNGATTEDLFNLCTGTYAVTITAKNGCSKVLGVYIEKSCYGDPALMTESPAPLIVNPSVNSTSNSSSNNGFIMLELRGGASPYYFHWSGPNGYRAREQKIENLRVGTYCATVTDACGQSYSNCFMINDCSKAAPMNVSLNTDGKSCNRVIETLPGATVRASPYGGIPPYTYSWSTGSITNPLQYTRPGGYSVTVTDSKSCKAVASVQVGDSYSETRNGCLISAFCDGIPVGTFINPSEATINTSQLVSKCQIIINCKNTSNVILQGVRKRLPLAIRVANCVDGELCEFTLGGQTFALVVRVVRQTTVNRELRLTCPNCYGCFEITKCLITGQELSAVQISLNRCPPPPPPIPPFLNEQEIMATIPDRIDGIKIARTKTELDSLIHSLSRIQLEPQKGIYLSNNSLNTNDLYSVYPNPFDNNISIDYVAGEARELEVEIVNLYGQPIFTKSFHSIQGNNSHLLQMNDNSPTGIYILRMKSRDNILYTTKLIKAN